ncbi:glucosaminidase domain-containing protein [Pedobacter sp. SL55]|uniref:glucosaminidase domain-containing protein n=1 Tax=Pedobacter sp. SL55 TaxID=2995161 RepID=UPI002270BBB8|nr:glucosaminidase domain-containing protein [Pedobacter sp. SL55]WAC41754.1 glucosaminidase domain-containing protein [Pedobacter sp. SL55]
MSKNKNLLLLAFLVVFASACKTKQYSKNNKQIEKNAKKDNPNPISYTTLSYIDAFKAIAIEEMNKYGIPASITLAQGILESGSGSSDLAKYANNHFGIKCTSDWKGKAYYKDDDQRDDCFRVYKDPRESYKDHSEFLKRKRYAGLFELDKNDYRNWAIGLKNAGYATNPKYPELLINIIEKYQLYQYDQSESEREKLAREDKVFKEINANIPNEKKLYTPVNVAPKDPPKDLIDGKYHTVVQGDTLYKISQLYKISVEELKTLNQLPDNNIKIGQKLIVVK